MLEAQRAGIAAVVKEVGGGGGGGDGLLATATRLLNGRRPQQRGGVLSYLAATPQVGMGAAFMVMGGACVVAPTAVLRFSFTPAAREGGLAERPLVRLLTQCFGAQAMLAGSLLCTTTMDKRAYLLWGLAMLPFVWFDVEYYRRGVLTAAGALGDAAGNLLFLVGSFLGFAAAPETV